MLPEVIFRSLHHPQLAETKVLGTIGFIIGIGLWQFIELGYFQPWEKLPAPPHVITELISTPTESPFIKTIDGNTYRYSSWHNEGWIQEAINQDYYPGPFEITKPCNFSSPEFSFFANHPKHITDCLQENIMYADGSGRYAFVLDSNGYIWEWTHVLTAYDTLSAMICFPFSGLLIGVAIAFLVKKRIVDNKIA